MNTTMRFAVVGVLLAVFVLVAGCESVKGWGVSVGGGKDAGEQTKDAGKAGPPDHAPAWGYRAKHQYRYYPDRNVYYDSERKMYFYISGDGWKVAASLPVGTSIAGLDYVEIEMDSDKPYTENAEHREKYPPGQAKKKDKGKGKKK
ncbi:MAG: hypothetical protein AB1921_00990 [Thermodesulfobacteriota bacterium]